MRARMHAYAQQTRTRWPEHVNPKLPPAVRGGMESSYGWLMKTRLSFFNTVVSLLCGNGVAAPVPVGVRSCPRSADMPLFLNVPCRGAWCRRGDAGSGPACTQWGAGAHAEPLPALRLCKVRPAQQVVHDGAEAGVVHEEQLASPLGR